MQVSFRKKPRYRQQFTLVFAAAVYLGSGFVIFASPQTASEAQPVNLAAPASPADQSDSADNSDSTNESATALAKKLQNPIGNLYSIPFQSNTNFNYGPNRGTQELVNIQPVLPIHLNAQWNIITRTILPLIWQPSLKPAHTVPFGTGAASFSAFLSPGNPSNGWLWGAGPIFQIPTATSKTLGSNVWGGGPTGVLVYMKGPVVAGVLVNNVWLTLYIQNKSPGADKEANWLPAPDGTIYLVMRLYWPKTTPPSILPAGSGTWKPPAVMRA
jgi:Protein of unknown function (DUF1214)